MSTKLRESGKTFMQFGDEVRLGLLLTPRTPPLGSCISKKFHCWKKQNKTKKNHEY